MSGRLQGKVAVVTGAGTEGGGLGNGKAAAVLFAREGATICCIDRDATAANETANIIIREGGRALALGCDVTQEQDVRSMVATCIGEFGKVDVLHNNVGIAVGGGMEDLSAEDWDRAFSVNVKSVFLVCREVLPHMVGCRNGSIVNISTISSLRSMRGLSYVSYPASKAALNQLTRVIAGQYAAYGVRCNAVLPGFIVTPMVERSVVSAALLADGSRPTLQQYLDLRSENIPMRRWGDAWDVAKAALFLASDESSYITGLEMVVDGGATLLTG